MDLVIRNATLADGRRNIDIAIDGDTIAAVGPALQVQAGREIDVGGDLVSTPFVDAHFHMDATLSYGLPRVNASGTLLEGIFGYQETPTVSEVAVYFIYLIPALVLYVSPPGKKTTASRAA